MLIFDETAPKRKMLLIERPAPVLSLPPAPYLGTIVVTGEAIRSVATTTGEAVAGGGSIESCRSGYSIGGFTFGRSSLCYGRSYSMNNFQRFGLYK